MAANNVPPTTLITTKLLYNGSIRRFKIYLKDCGANTLPGKLKDLLTIPEHEDVVFERWSDSLASYVVLDSNKPAVYKQLYRAAKAKLKLRIKVTHPVPEAPVPEPFIGNSNNSTETLLPPYASSITNQSVISTEPGTSTSVPFEKVSEAVVAYLEGEEGRTKLRTAIGEEVEKEIEKRHVLAQSVANLAASVPAVEATPATPVAPKTRECVVKQVYAVYCNICTTNVDSVHYHCGVCDSGDFDLCEKCVEKGMHCDSAEHWMVKRSIVGGEVIASRELIASTTAIAAKKPEILNQKVEEKVEEPQDVSGRTCNCCCEDFDDSHFVECTVCPDYDLCLECHMKQNHGHDPSHSFKPATEETVLTAHAKTLLGPGKNFRHFAICDGCDKQIYGVRHKCFTCPDWDFCMDCYKSAKEIHPGHRFAPIYDVLTEAIPASARQTQHFGVYCDGPHCTSKGVCSWIVGDRYKCAICPDLDLCAGCEASPMNTHNSTHPLIKIKSPIRNVTVQTLDSETSVQLGDRAPSVTSVVSNASTSVQTVAETQPKEEEEVVAATPVPIAEEVIEKVVEKVEEKIEVKADEKVSEVVEQEPVEEEEQHISERGDVLITAAFVSETVADGTVFKAGEQFTQTWNLVNDGCVSWPAGTTIKFLGGDNMSGTEMTVTESKVKSCNAVDFSVKLAPAPTSRRLISYWGLVTSDGVRFGPQLWCDVEVKAEEITPLIVKPEEVSPVVVECLEPVVVESIKPVVVEEAKAEVAELSKEAPKEEVKEEESKIEDDVADLIKSHTSQMIFPTLEKESPSNSTANIREAPVEVTPEEAQSSAAPTTTAVDEENCDDDVMSEVYSVDELDDELENFISDDEDYEVWEASDDEEFGSSTNGSTGTRA